ncbi:MAG: DUF4175 family protein, partial [Pseudomonadota bacterium]
MSAKQKLPQSVPRLSLWLTGAGVLAERVLRRFWPFFAIVITALALLFLGIQDLVPVEWVWIAGLVSVFGAIGALIWGARGFRWPRRNEMVARLDESLPGRPIQALLDDQAIGASDYASVALWRAHQDRMAERAAQAGVVKPDLRLSSRDPFALRYVALLVFLVALLFGSIWKVGSVADMAPGTASAAAGPSWEGWIEPPRYTGRPTLYLADLTDETLEIAEGSRLILHFYGDASAIGFTESVSGSPTARDPASEHQFDIIRSGELSITGSQDRAWKIRVIQDENPRVGISGLAEAEAA